MATKMRANLKITPTVWGVS